MQDTETILVVDDTSTNIDILVELLSDYDVLVALDGETAIDLASEEKIDLILLDIVMPELDGFQTCLRLKKIEAAKDIPIVFITANTDEDSIETAYDSGGIDYVTKPFKPKELLARVKAQLKIRSLIAHLEQLSSYDEMTGLFNRRKFFEQAQLFFNNKTDNLCAMMFDIDKFKDINDKYGHPFGDKVIKLVASTMTELVPAEAVLGRLGGEEFALVTNDLSKAINCTLIENIRQHIEVLNISTDEGETVNFTISGGLAIVDTETSNLDHLLKLADDALYEAKGEGRNRTVFR